MKNFIASLFCFILLIASCKKKENDVEPNENVTMHDSVEVFNETARLGIIKFTYQNSKIISLEMISDTGQLLAYGYRIDLHYGDDDYLDSTTNYENGNKSVTMRYYYDQQKRLSFRSFRHTEYANSFLYKTDSIIIKNFNNNCYGYPNICETTPEGFSMNVEKPDTLVLGTQGEIIKVNNRPVVYTDFSIRTTAEMEKLMYVVGDDLFFNPLVDNRKLIKSIVGDPNQRTIDYEFDSNNRIHQTTYSSYDPTYNTSFYRRCVFHY